MVAECWDTIELKGHEVLKKINELIAEGNLRHVRIRQGGRTLAEFPLTAGVVGAALSPVLAAIGAIAALVTQCSIDVERVQPTTSSASAPAGSRP